MSDFIALNVPHGMFRVINPFQESDGVYTSMTESKLKCPLNIDEIHPGLRYFYGLLKPMELGPLIDVEVVWFGSENQYCAIAVGPFGRTPEYHKELMKFRQLTSSMQVPEAWMHLVFVNTVAGHFEP